MQHPTIIKPHENIAHAPLEQNGLNSCKTIYLQSTPEELVELALKEGEGVLTDAHALMCDTGTFTGRSPKDKFIVRDELTEDLVHWGEINNPITPSNVAKIYHKMQDYLNGKTVYTRYAYAGADEQFRQPIMATTTQAWQGLFCHHMFIRTEEDELADFSPQWTILCIPEFQAEAKTDGTRQGNFTIIDFSNKKILIGGSGYAGEIKKAIFTVMNFILPVDYQILPMHCSANIGNSLNGQPSTALFFGLSGTGKTTLSADPSRELIGDDEHGWSAEGIFNFEGGCYAKVVNLTMEQEPEIFAAIREQSILENTRFFPDTNKVDFSNISVTENTRTAYPIHFISNACHPSVGPVPDHIFFLTADAFGVLPPLSKLTTEQAMYYFQTGYTAKLAGTEMGINQPVATFSACFGEAFLPLHPKTYTQMLGERLEQSGAQVWLLNTGWISGPYGIGNRIPLAYTRALLHAVLDNSLEHVQFDKHPVFDVMVPQHCPNVPDTILNPEYSWLDPEEYERKAWILKEKFDVNALRFAPER
ncbi:phosphoenolpyruvate carboxykinase (ATP) [Dyadobacter tibetensis]|uniref:phosphoenolpyruvate carboxykinase (ATP) n=1 Tax=Dyadobacter tibetensis TaxID=1211851 RepID=UPI0004719644|nr:phosphoenolpyruvate carboxykinase (ATP) [Dyadobacter tibetensis]